MPYDRQLTDERHLCTGAVNQFNSTTSAAVAIARDERGRHFKTIIAARWIPPRTTERHIGGHLGGNVHVTAPFHCDYGYNISIGDNVVIGPSCQLLDSARICIGRNSKIGARVTISTMKTPTDPKSLKGSNGHEIAQDVYIGENVYIGDGCIIEAGVKIGDGAIVRAGSVVVRVSCQTPSTKLELILDRICHVNVLPMVTLPLAKHTISNRLLYSFEQCMGKSSLVPVRFYRHRYIWRCIVQLHHCVVLGVWLAFIMFWRIP